MIIFINGSINAGKSTVAKMLAQKIPNTALIEVDVFHDMIEWMSIDQSVPINLANAVSIIKNFAERGLNVIVPYPLSQKNYDFMTQSLAALNTKILFFTLAPTIDIAMSDRGERKLVDWQRKRIQHHYDIGIHNPAFGTIIDNTHQTPEETTAQILNQIEKI